MLERVPNTPLILACAVEVTKQRKWIFEYYGSGNNFNISSWNINAIHCVKNVRIRSYSGPHFPAFGLNTERYTVSLHIHSECGKIRTRITPNTDTFHSLTETNGGHLSCQINLIGNEKRF